MTYQETIDFLFSQLPMYQREGKAAYKADLSNTIALCEYLGNPETKFKTIHVAGTNGKGSTSHFIASILQEAGYKVGLYTSPHLVDFRERIRINGEMIPEENVSDFVQNKSAILKDISPSFFEWTVGMAFSYFADQEVDVAIIETGLGGRLDSTNVITPLVSVITNIGLDHTQFLGNTLPLIAKEKAGIIKRNVPVVIGESQVEVADVFLDRAKVLSAPLLFADKQEKLMEFSELVSYQRINSQTAIEAIKAIPDSFFKVSFENILEGIRKVSLNTGLRGRWQIIGKNPLIVADTAHNIEGLNYVCQQIRNQSYSKLRYVFGMVNDKNAEAVIDMLPEGEFYLCAPQISRAMPVNELADIFNSKKKSNKIFTSVNAALEAAKADSQEDDMIYIGGSTFVVAEIF